MNFINRQEGGVAVVEVHGRLDSSGAPLMEQHLRQLFASGANRIVLDGTGLDYVSSAGLRVLLVAAKQAQNARGKMVLACLNKEVEEIFEIAGFSAVIPIYKEINEAVRACGGSSAS